MRFAPLIEKIARASNEAELRDRFMDYAGELVGATAWGLDLLDSRFRVVESDFFGLPSTFCNHYQSVGQAADRVSQAMIQHQIPAHTLSVQSLHDWHQSPLYQEVFRSYEMEHGMVAPLIGRGRLMGGIYFIRGKENPAFSDADLIHVSPLCQHLSVRFTAMRQVGNSSVATCLTPRELDIVELVAQGFTNREIALKLTVSRDAIKQALKRIFLKLDVSARAAMVAKVKG